MPWSSLVFPSHLKNLGCYARKTLKFSSIHNTLSWCVLKKRRALDPRPLPAEPPGRSWTFTWNCSRWWKQPISLLQSCETGSELPKSNSFTTDTSGLWNTTGINTVIVCKLTGAGMDKYWNWNSFKDALKMNKTKSKAKQELELPACWYSKFCQSYIDG